MLATVSVCDEVTAPLAAVLAERADAGDVLAELERATSLVTGSGTARGAFRVHPLLRAQLRADLRRRRPDRFAALHGRAARARQGHGDVVGALHHAALADDAVLLGELLDVHGPALATSGHHAAVLAALDALPLADVSDAPGSSSSPRSPTPRSAGAPSHTGCSPGPTRSGRPTRTRGWPRCARGPARLGRLGSTGGDPPEPGAGTPWSTCCCGSTTPWRPDSGTRRSHSPGRRAPRRPGRATPTWRRAPSSRSASWGACAATSPAPWRWPGGPRRSLPPTAGGAPSAMRTPASCRATARCWGSGPRSACAGSRRWTG